ncbi:photosynthetic NDH subunit of lumenal location 2, chloroplastic [Humulus lupulus]|uniref:photosynthetic NDH subunit of lumenal location 2, chloroplastic n=1 Tax=Humulus lupulus TaxID=3486 RepID=UPI002B414141|nr:photosynthetic NDH subunit of lumenal location 2, chloroplastic [Humulus lupulus]
MMSSFLIRNTPSTSLLGGAPIHQQHDSRSPPIRASSENKTTCRRNIVIRTLLAASLGMGLSPVTTPIAMAQNWGTRSFIKERFFEPGLSPEDAVARIRQTAEGLRSIREMLENMSWRYVLFYIRLKTAYLSQDLKNAMTILPQARHKDYVKAANELVENMSELDHFVRTPKIYESYLYYEKTLKSIDDVVALL